MPQAKAELVIVLRVLAEQVIARPDVQAWWDTPTIALSAMGRTAQFIDETCERLNLNFAPLLFVLRSVSAEETGPYGFTMRSMLEGARLTPTTFAPLRISFQDVEEPRYLLAAAVETFNQGVAILASTDDETYAERLSDLAKGLTNTIATVRASSTGRKRRESEEKAIAFYRMQTGDVGTRAFGRELVCETTTIDGKRKATRWKNEIARLLTWSGGAETT